MFLQDPLKRRWNVGADTRYVIGFLLNIWYYRAFRETGNDLLQMIKVRENSYRLKGQGPKNASERVSAKVLSLYEKNRSEKASILAYFTQL